LLLNVPGASESGGGENPKKIAGEQTPVQKDLDSKGLGNGVDASKRAGGFTRLKKGQGAETQESGARPMSGWGLGLAPAGTLWIGFALMGGGLPGEGNVEEIEVPEKT